jgi:glucose-6-phosphate 1-dehydrogenase
VSRVIDRLAIFGGTGDLTARYLLPGLAALHAAGLLSGQFRLTGAGREDWDTDQFRRWAGAQLEQYAPELPSDTRRAIVSASSYHRLDVGDHREVAAAVAGDGPLAAYLALPPAVFPPAVSALFDAGLPPGSRIVLEKPFGVDLASAAALNNLLAEGMSEQEVFRVDHFLAMSTVRNILGFRLANRMLEPIWNSAHIERIDIVWDESLALEGRASYYDGVGALKDMVQNHLLQLFCLVAMEPPVSLGERDLRDRKVDALRSVLPLSADDVARHTRRARYAAGALGGRRVPAYVDEAGVDPGLRTETFAQVDLKLDTWRWQDTTFRLRSGKAFGRDRKQVEVHFRQAPHLPFWGVSASPNVLRFGLEPESLALELNSLGPWTGRLERLTLDAETKPADLPAYAYLLSQVLNQQAALSIRGDEAEESWRVVTPVLDAWAKDLVPMEEYPAGSDGPS